jgi:hypothetical protein
MMAMNVFFAGVPVKNYQAACTWYERLLGRPPDMLPNEIEAAWRFSDTAWMYFIVDADRAGKALLTLIIDDLDQHVAALGERLRKAIDHPRNWSPALELQSAE